MRTRVIAGTSVDMDEFEQRVREMGEKYKAKDLKIGQKIVDKAAEIVAWYAEHQCPMRPGSLAKILEEL